MLTGLTYDHVWEHQTRVWSPNRVLNFTPQEWIVYLNWLGFECDFISIDGEAQELMLDFLPLGLPYFCGIGLPLEHPKYGDDNAHALVITPTGRVWNPLEDIPGDLSFADFRRVIKPS